MNNYRKQKKFLIKKKANKPFFTIITVVKNAEKDIVKTLNSISEQTFKNFEYLVIDGKSKDQTIQKILKYKKNINLLISEKDKGIYFAMNKGLRLANGEVIVFVNAGDKLTKNALRIVNNFMKISDQIFLYVKVYSFITYITFNIGCMYRIYIMLVTPKYLKYTYHL